MGLQLSVLAPVDDLRCAISSKLMDREQKLFKISHCQHRMWTPTPSPKICKSFAFPAVLISSVGNTQKVYWIVGGGGVWFWWWHCLWEQNTLQIERRVENQMLAECRLRCALPQNRSPDVALLRIAKAIFDCDSSCPSSWGLFKPGSWVCKRSHCDSRRSERCKRTLSAGKRKSTDINCLGPGTAGWAKGVFHAKGWWSKSSLPRKIVLLGLWREGTWHIWQFCWDVPGGPLGVYC